MLDVCLLGTGGMEPLPKRWLTALMTRYNGSSLLIDCGEGTQIAIRENGWTFNSLDVICITHFHGDHISGLPGVLLAMANSDREKELIMIGPKGLKRVVNALRVVAPDLPFDIKFIELEEDVQDFEFNGYHIRAFKVNHKVTCYGYSLSIHRAGKFDVEKARELNVPLKCWNRLQKGEILEIDGCTYTPDMVLGPERKGLKITYTTDTRPTKSIEENAKGSDLFICEGMYGERGEVNNAVKYKHMTFEEAGKLAKKAEVKELWLTHYSPALLKPEMYINDVRAIFPETYPGKDGKSRVFMFEED